MLIAALVFVACQTLVFTCFGILAVRFFRREYRQLREEAAEALRGFVSAPDANTPSPLAAMCDQLALLLAARLVQQIKAMLAGVESGASKGEQLGLMQEASQSSPWLSLIAGMLPARLRNQLLKNPQMVGALSKMVGTGGNHRQDTSEIAPRRHRD
jgi:hypothetical protein